MAKRFREEQQEQLSENTATPTSQLKFVVDAWMQVGAGGGAVEKLVERCKHRGCGAALWRSLYQGTFLGVCFGSQRGVDIAWGPAVPSASNGLPLSTYNPASASPRIPNLHFDLHPTFPVLLHFQVVQCRRVLKWTYATAYYAFADSLDASTEDKERLGQQQEFFEFNQVRPPV
jgi:hypothetical protein